MTQAQKEILTGIVSDDAVTITTIEYPASTGQDTFRCLKVCYMVVIDRDRRHFVDWYGVEGGVVATREIDKVPDGFAIQESFYGGWQYGRLIGDVPYWAATKYESREAALAQIEKLVTA